MNGNSSQFGFIAGGGAGGANPQPGILFDLGVAQKLTQVNIFYADRYGDGVSAPSRVDISVDGGTPFTSTAFDITQNVNSYGDARAVTIDLTGYTGRYVQMDVYNPPNYGAPGGEWTALNEVMFYGSTATDAGPVIVKQPTPSDLTVYATQSATFQALVSGTEPLSYQWWKNGVTPIPGATGASYTIASAQLSDTASYTLVVTNSFGAVTSAVANLTVILGPPVITSQPTLLTLEQGYSRVLGGVAASGLQPFSYQWTKDGTTHCGATNSSFALLHAQTGDYQVILTNIFGSATSAVLVTVVPTNTIAIASYTYTSGTLAGAGGAFETTNHSILGDGFATTQEDVEAAAGNPWGYYVNGNSPQFGFIAGGGAGGANPQPGILFDLGAAQKLTQVNIFYVDRYGHGVSAPSSAVISVDGGTPFTNTGFDTSQNANNYGDARALTIDLTGYTGRYVQMNVYNPPNYGWPGGEWTALNEVMFYGSTATDAGPVIVKQPTPSNLTIFATQSATFQALASGTEPLSYQWWKDGVTPVPGATGASYTIPNAQVSDTANYTLVVTNSFGAVTSATAQLTVLVPPAPSITNQPAGFTLEQGYSRLLRVGADGLPPLSYQWTIGGTAIAGATDAEYAILYAQGTDAGNYQVVVTNNGGATTSGVATVTVVATNTINIASYTYTTPQPWGGPGVAFEQANLSILRDGFATTPADVGTVPGVATLYLDGNSDQPGFIVGITGGVWGGSPQPGVLFDLGAIYELTAVRVFYVNASQSGVKSPTYVRISVDGGTPFEFSGFDSTPAVAPDGEPREVTINLSGYTGRQVQMDFYGYSEWTGLNEVMFYGNSGTVEEPPISFTTSGGQLTLDWTGTGYHSAGQSGGEQLGRLDQRAGRRQPADHCPDRADRELCSTD